MNKKRELRNNKNANDYECLFKKKKVVLPR